MLTTHIVYILPVKCTQIKNKTNHISINKQSNEIAKHNRFMSSEDSTVEWLQLELNSDFKKLGKGKDVCPAMLSSQNVMSDQDYIYQSHNTVVQWYIPGREGDGVNLQHCSEQVLLQTEERPPNLHTLQSHPDVESHLLYRREEGSEGGGMG